ncbi:MAG: archease [Chloroflexota bacterium]|nr:archease [Chloroflexota bacterium]
MDLKRFDLIEHTADVGVVAYGADIKQAFANVAYAMFSLLVDLNSVEELVKRKIEVQAEDMEVVLVTCLNELLYVFEVERLLFRRFEVDDLSDGSITLRCWGEPIDTNRHGFMTGIKAATYHMFEISEINGITSIRVFFDA